LDKKDNHNGYLGVKAPLPGLNDLEGDSIPKNIDRVIDSHVHLFPSMIFNAVWRWFDKYGWPVRYQLHSSDLLNFLFNRGVEHVVAFQYAHKPGISDWLNDYMVAKVDEFQGRVTGLATVFPGEEGAVDILNRGFDKGLKGVKLHVHVQCFDPVSKGMEPLYEFCSARKKPMVIHAGREPKSPEYSCDPHELCSAERIEQVILRYPDLRLCVPHFGMDEYDDYSRLIRDYNNLWVDTAMAITDYLPVEASLDLLAQRSDRILYGSDFPNIPYAWDRELKCLENSAISRQTMQEITWKNAVKFFDI
jgi:predicted TIM-barrel fold metal-dependent hydrolase